MSDDSILKQGWWKYKKIQPKGTERAKREKGKRCKGCGAWVKIIKNGRCIECISN